MWAKMYGRSVIYNMMKNVQQPWGFPNIQEDKKGRKQIMKE